MRGVVLLAVGPGVAQRADVTLALRRDAGVALRTSQAAAAAVGRIGEEVDAGPVAAAGPDRVVLLDARHAGAEAIDAAAVDAGEAGHAVGRARHVRRRGLTDSDGQEDLHAELEAGDVLLRADPAWAG